MYFKYLDKSSCWKQRYVLLLSLTFFFINLFFLLKDNCFTEFCCFLSNLKMNQLQGYIYPLSFETLSISLPISPLQVDTEPLFEFPEPYSKFPLAIYFTYGNISFHVTLSYISPSLHSSLPPRRCVRHHFCDSISPKAAVSCNSFHYSGLSIPSLLYSYFFYFIPSIFKTSLLFDI